MDVTCPYCGEPLNPDDRWGGGLFPCPYCGKEMRLPKASSKGRWKCAIGVIGGLGGGVLGGVGAGSAVPILGNIGCGIVGGIFGLMGAVASCC